jgi:hypothetical protein
VILKRSPRRQLTRWVVAALLAAFIPAAKPALAQSGDTSLIIYVKDAPSGKPIFQARLTLLFNKKGGKMKKRGTISYSAKTNPQGRYRFTEIPFGTVRLIVTAKNHQTLSQDFQLTKTNQVINITLKPPHALL